MTDEAATADPSGRIQNIFIAMPVYGGEMKSDTAAAVDQVLGFFNKLGLSYLRYQLSMCDIVDARNASLTKWYDAHPESTHCLFIDSDMYFGVQQVSDMIALDKPLVGVVYSKREIPGSKEDGTPDLQSITIGEPILNTPLQIVHGCQQWKYVGGGVLLIKREVVTRMLEKFPEMADYTNPGSLAKTGVTRMIRAFDKMKDDIGRPLSEDYSFCERWRKCGGEVWASVDHPIGHIGLHTYWFHAAAMGLAGKPVQQPAQEVAA